MYLVPLEFRIDCRGLGLGCLHLFFARVIKLGKSTPGISSFFTWLTVLLRASKKLIEILLVKENLVFFVGEAFIVLIIPLFAFRDREVIIIGPG